MDGANNSPKEAMAAILDDDNATTSGSERPGNESPRSRTPLSNAEAWERALSGMRRRRFQGRGTRAKVRDAVSQLFTVMAVCAAAVGAWSQEVMDGGSGLRCMGAAATSTPFSTR